MPLLSTRCPWNCGEGRKGEEWSSHLFEKEARLGYNSPSGSLSLYVSRAHFEKESAETSGQPKHIPVSMDLLRGHVGVISVSRGSDPFAAGSPLLA